MDNLREKYKPTMPYPDRNKIRDRFFEGFDALVGTKQQLQDEENRLKKMVEEEHNKQLKLYYKSQVEAMERFKNDMFEELGITDNSKRNLLFEKAWEFGHSCGYESVAAYMCDMVELIE